MTIGRPRGVERGWEAESVTRSDAPPSSNRATDVLARGWVPPRSGRDGALGAAGIVQNELGVPVLGDVHARTRNDPLAEERELARSVRVESQPNRRSLVRAGNRQRRVREPPGVEVHVPLPSLILEEQARPLEPLELGNLGADGAARVDQRESPRREQQLLSPVASGNVNLARPEAVVRPARGERLRDEA